MANNIETSTRLPVKITDAAIEQAPIVAMLVKSLLLELEPEAENQLNQIDLTGITIDLIEKQKIFALLATQEGNQVGLATLHECAAIYAGGIFGEISELYVVPEYRSQNVGQLLIEAVVTKAGELGWKRIEVGSPPPNEWLRTVEFYKKNGFSESGTRLRHIIL